MTDFSIAVLLISIAIMAKLLLDLSHEKNSHRDTKRKLTEARGRASTNHVTGLPNMYALQKVLEIEFDRLNRGKLTSIGVVAIDLNNFKPVNDRFGHQNGDEVLRTFGKVLVSATRPSDMVVHRSGDEFILLFLDTSERIILRILERVKEKLFSVQYSFATAEELGLGFSFGIGFAQKGDTFEEVYYLADKRCERMKCRNGFFSTDSQMVQ